MQRKTLYGMVLCAVTFAACRNITSPEDVAARLPIEHLAIFVRDWPNDYVEIDFRRTSAGSVLVMFRPPQTGMPRVLIDSIGPVQQDPPEVVEMFSRYNVWAMADSNAVGAACNTKSGAWHCTHTVEDYSLVMYVVRGGVSRSQRYTALRDSKSRKTARALGDYVLAWMRERAGDDGFVKVTR